ncbi:2,3-dihydro-2,3-dihydroxybenzoate dehydrogenase [Vibrio sp. V27_P1S3P104]|uniref:2,3-dihydro-2,3-dihydroxybenzoate dehydrogenase n=1 Tax=Vibrio TaxID=662 RepID=UPI000C16B491|nr:MULTISPECIES: 2,3-dihydro-2,3-dihydroxybenzoate dehydrogenase [Vibrio]NAW68704.1 2,3-dihydro-2,3-dihydroxybenzoate dehydrogenase [Vibrio sp. V28_P6S34P95]NAX04410.1 2,3-dihydro-2,3-dihydroxybenzoate dehydrogenase [Vibrio sp. V30_P3S12P165]NAX33969.1 2,3-dihydro-2,3-dihydroxybenzoate dehydrogenase [Vibrio sp. V29_P1S30P107]NAX36905.1 2,3-dihydro-2,3-dihydroxybenzoate dehydrogenase [Vibrio sp. V27_P1S3P104]NAX39541.1 2,3-dihydro-2,3-dihydroxybenzoate dehydrogenase [Vibrio sp. V26_P1S5P106]
MDVSLNNQTVLVTGAARGIGLSVVEQLLKQNAKVVATDVRMQTLLSNTELLRVSYGQQLQCAELDVAQIDRVADMMADLQQQYGPIDHLVSCAGILHLGAIHEMPFEQIHETFMVNTFGILNLMQALSHSMKEAKRGSMVIVGSNAANTPRPNMGAYGASKSALHMLVKCIGIELASYGVRCNIVSPGSTRTDMQMQLWTESYGEAQAISGDAVTYRLGIPLQKIAEPVDIARTILFLLSDAANHITMHDLRVDGGATLDN